MTNKDHAIQNLRGTQGKNMEYSEEDRENMSIKQTADSDIPIDKCTPRDAPVILPER